MTAQFANVKYNDFLCWRGEGRCRPTSCQSRHRGRSERTVRHSSDDVGDVPGVPGNLSLCPLAWGVWKGKSSLLLRRGQSGPSWEIDEELRRRKLSLVLHDYQWDWWHLDFNNLMDIDKNLSWTLIFQIVNVDHVQFFISQSWFHLRRVFVSLLISPSPYCWTIFWHI